MRVSLVLLPLSLAASSALAQSAPPPPAFQVPPQLTDPAMADRLANIMQSLSKSFLDLPVGEVEAAIEGRTPSSAERRLTVRDMGRRNDPDFDRKVERQIAEAKPMMRQSMKALSDSLPQMMQGLEHAKEALDRAVANMPDPNYPKR